MFFPPPAGERFTATQGQANHYCRESTGCEPSQTQVTETPSLKPPGWVQGGRNPCRVLKMSQCLRCFRFNVNILAFESVDPVFHWSWQGQVAFSEKNTYFYSQLKVLIAENRNYSKVYINKPTRKL